MKNLLYLVLLFLSLFVASCETLSLPMRVSGFKIKVVDADSRAPISGANVNQATMHQTGRKSFERESRYLGKTDSQGIIHVGNLNMKLRSHTIYFEKSGYDTLDLIVQNISGQYIGMHISRSAEKIGGKVTITEDAVVTIPMRRK